LYHKPVETRKNFPSGLKEMCIGVKLTKESPKAFRLMVLDCKWLKK
jgi:hypothetical protein